MAGILSITGVIFIVIATGYATVRFGVFSEREMATLGKFVVNLALPALIFRAVSASPPSAIANPGYLGAVLSGSLAVFALGYFWSRLLAGGSAQASTFRAMGMSCANSGFIGYPLLLMALPEVASTALALNMIVENLVLLPLVLVLAERAQGAARGEARGAALAGQILRRLARNPILIALVLGLAVSTLRIGLPPVLARPVEIFAGASAALSLAVIGGTLAALPLRGLDARALAPVAAVVAGKLVLHPAAIALGLAVMAAAGFGVVDADLAAAAVIIAATPVMAVYPILAQLYGEARDASLAMFVMTLVSFFSITAVLAIVLP